MMFDANICYGEYLIFLKWLYPCLCRRKFFCCSWQYQAIFSVNIVKAVGVTIAFIQITFIAAVYGIRKYAKC